MKPEQSPRIYVEESKVVEQTALPAQQFHLRLFAPKCAQCVFPGNFIHICCDNRYRLRRPLSVMRTDPASGIIDVLYKVVGEGTAWLSTMRAGHTTSCMGPIGNQFRLDDDTAIPLLLGGGVGIPPIVFFAEYLHKTLSIKPLVLMGSEIPYPFSTRPSRLMVSGIPASSISAMTLLDDLGIPSRLSSQQGYTGSYAGYVHELASHWLEALDPSSRNRVRVFACGPEPMLSAVATLCGAHNLPCQLSLEEYMACAVGGCAGCTVKTWIQGKAKMQRVCVDGPVFDARLIYPDVYRAPAGASG